MSFRRRNVGIPSTSTGTNNGTSSSTRTPDASSPPTNPTAIPAPIETATVPDKHISSTTTPATSHPHPPSPSSSLSGTRPSPVGGRPTTSTGTPTLDKLLAGHAGLPLGTSLLVEEGGTTDYGGALLRYFAAEGLVQGHPLYVVGAHERWARELPGLVGPSLGKEGERDKERGCRGGAEKASGRGEAEQARQDERMKIAWRYEKLGQVEAGAVSARDPMQQRRGAGDLSQVVGQPFCHVFDLRKKLEHPPDASVSFLRPSHHPETSPFTPILEQLQVALAASKSFNKVHRLVVPGLLSPQAFPPHSSIPHHILQFLKGVRALLCTYPNRFVAMITLPLFLFPRASGLVRWMELLSDGVIELAPFPHSHSQEPGASLIQTSGESGNDDEPPQGLLKIHRLPVFHERGVGTSTAAEDWAFTLSRRKFVIKPYSLPPIEGDTESQQIGPAGHQPKKSDMDF